VDVRAGRHRDRVFQVGAVVAAAVVEVAAGAVALQRIHPETVIIELNMSEGGTETMIAIATAINDRRREGEENEAGAQ